MLVSLVIRTLNEEVYLKELLSAIVNQKLDGFDLEIVIIDSGSTDATLSIAESFSARITHISKEEFTFGRSLNMGSDFADGDILVYVSGHCIPSTDQWLCNLVKPILDGIAQYTYGRQIGRDTTKYSERKIFDNTFRRCLKSPKVIFFATTLIQPFHVIHGLNFNLMSRSRA